MADQQLILCVSSARSNAQRRRAIRRSWFTLKTAANPWLTPAQQQSIELRFVVSATDEGAAAADDAVAAEQAEHGDMLLVDAPEGYQHLWRKALVSLQHLEQSYGEYAYYMHADDDSYVRLDLLLQLLAASPRQRFYWGYVWNRPGNPTTSPIRNPRNKSHMPYEQYALDHYPPFASGCGFVLSRDLVQALLRQPLPDYRLLDPPFGIHLCGADFCVLPDGPVQPVHDGRVRPYRGLPIFQADTVVQHYLCAEEMAPFHQQVLQSLVKSIPWQPGSAGGDAGPSGGDTGGSAGRRGAAGDDAAAEQGSTSAEELYKHLVQLGLLRR